MLKVYKTFRQPGQAKGLRTNIGLGNWMILESHCERFKMKREIFGDRVYRVLWAVVDSYISNPDPVGSRYITKKYGFNLSPATIRNIMADLEEMGYLRQPHTSAGRIPTDKGYRFYVESLWLGAVDHSLFEELKGRLENIRNDINELLDKTAKTISEATHYLGIAVPPKPDKTIFKKINLYKYKENRIVIVLITEEGIIKNKIIEFDHETTDRDLKRISDYLNTRFSGYSFDEIRKSILREMDSDRVICDRLISKAMKVCEEVLYAGQNTVFISGLSEVLELPDFSDLKRIKAIMRTIEDKHRIIKLLDMLADEDGVKVVIGSENPVTEMTNLSVIASTYREGDRQVGAVGIIGPTRMDYLRAIAIVDATARYISERLSEK